MEFVLNEYHRNTSDEELIEDVKRVADLLKKESLSCKDYSSHGRFSYPCHAKTILRTVVLVMVL